MRARDALHLAEQMVEVLGVGAAPAAARGEIRLVGQA